MRPIRSRPGWQIKEALRRSGVRQADIAKTCSVTTSFVSVLIGRGRIANRERAERVWQEIERVTAPLFVGDAG